MNELKTIMAGVMKDTVAILEKAGAIKPGTSRRDANRKAKELILKILRHPNFEDDPAKGEEATRRMVAEMAAQS